MGRFPFPLRFRLRTLVLLVALAGAYLGLDRAMKWATPAQLNIGVLALGLVAYPLAIWLFLRTCRRRFPASRSAPGPSPLSRPESDLDGRADRSDQKGLEEKSADPGTFFLS
jgi:hypothetical protein